MELSTRELAIAVWLTVGLAWALTQGPVRRSVVDLLSTLLHRKILTPILVVVVYVALVVAGLRWAGLWHSTLLKDTILWILASGIVLAMSALQIQSAVPTWRTVVKEQIQVIVVIEFLLNTYTFVLWIELLLIPALTFVAMLDAVTRTDSRYASVSRFTTFFESSFGFLVLVFALRRALQAPPTDVVAVARELLLPVVLSLSMLPLVYLYFLASVYEQLFLMVSLSKMDAPSQRYARWRLFRRIGVKPSVARDYLAHYGNKLRQARSKAEIDNLLTQRLD